MSEKLKLTIIGAGNIGGATAIGLANYADVTATARTEDTLSRYAGKGIRTMLDNLEAVRGADIVIFAIKPWLMEDVVKSTLPALELEHQTIVSMAPGVDSKDFLAWLGPEARLAYVIPNTAIEVGESMTFITPITTDKAALDQLVELFSCAGKSLVVEESHLRAGTSLASCGIAYALRYIHAAAQGGVELGFFAKDAGNIVAQTVKGAAALLDAHGTHPETEIDKVTTPGGLTIKGLNAMEEAGFSNSVIQGLKANGGLKSRVVVKVGSSVLTGPDGTLDEGRMASLVEQIVALKFNDYDVIVVSGGAVACGRSILGPESDADSVTQRQIYSSVGQVKLMELYNTMFSRYFLHIGQVLTMRSNFAPGKALSNQKSCLEAMMKSGLIPIVNANDSVSVNELMFTDNDEIAGLVARMMGAECLVILSDKDGIADKDSGIIRHVSPKDEPRHDLSSRYSIARNVASRGIKVLVANGTVEGILPSLLCTDEDVLCTEFEPYGIA